jgi:asparagine synthetase B (glutamine-hydrolysing)
MFDNQQITKNIHESRLIHRGPDVQSTLERTLSPEAHGIFYGSTLHFRGSLTPQPLQDDLGNILLWNGEIFDGFKVGVISNLGNLVF